MSLQNCCPLVIRWKTNLGTAVKALCRQDYDRVKILDFSAGPNVITWVQEEGRRVSLKGVAEEGAGEMRKEEESLMLLALRRMARKQRVGEALMPRATPGNSQQGNEALSLQLLGTEFGRQPERARKQILPRSSDQSPSADTLILDLRNFKPRHQTGPLDF